MRNRSRTKLPLRTANHGVQLSILELDRFSAANVAQWEAVSASFDEICAHLYFGTEPFRRLRRESLLEALRKRPSEPISFNNWYRLVTYKYCLMPLSAAGSLTWIGGRFNAGQELRSVIRPWPALYVAEDFETAFCERFGIKQSGAGGLTAQELALENGVSVTQVRLRGHVHSVFNAGDLQALAPFARILSKAHLPKEIPPLAKKLGLPRSAVTLIKTPELLRKCLGGNWRIGPVQYGLPAQTQTFADLVREAGYEAILYPSTKGSGKCLAIFPDNLQSSETFVELCDEPPAEVRHCRLDLTTCQELCGFEVDSSGRS